MEEVFLFCLFVHAKLPVKFFAGSFIISGGRKMKSKFDTKYVVMTAMFIAIAFVAVLIGKIVPNVAGFLSYDPKDAIVVIAGFISGPLTCVIISVLVSLIEMLTISTTGPYGLLMNIVSTCAFAVPAAWFYHKKNHTHKGAVIGLGLGVAFMTLCMLAWNYIVTPLYMGVDRSVVGGMLMSVFFPFNLSKGGINAGITLLLYKPLVTALRKAKLIKESSNPQKKTFNWGFTVFALAVLVTFAALLIVLIK